MTPQPHDLRLVPNDENLPYFVIGGRYSDTTFTSLTTAEATEGPFDSYDEAVEVWRAASMQHVDEAFVRYLVVQAASAQDAQTHAEESQDRPATRIA
ncbi:MAG: DUF4170 domain-containing protein [Dehalococcoidia bacterium]|jgi:hypothetical protein|nr:DUF4170 domain-containing protein [Dehalococcoidia bacterium]